MPYYAGDYYMGDYYMGDPGLFRFIGKALRFGGRIFKRGAPMVVPGTAAITLASRAPALIRAGRIVRGAGGLVRRGTRVLGPVGSAAVGGVAAAAGGAAIERVLTGTPAAAGMAGIAPGGAPGGAGEMLPRGYYVDRFGNVRRRRRMRVTNPRALRRAIRRATGFARLARRVLHFTSPRAPRGRAIFRSKRRAGARARV